MGKRRGTSKAKRVGVISPYVNFRTSSAAPKDTPKPSRSSTLYPTYRHPLETVCGCCGKVGHFKHECSKILEMCDLCGRSGHLKITCRYANFEAQEFCLCCGKPGHTKKVCPMKDKVCDICGMVGHLKSTCRSSPFALVQADVCSCCGKTGHVKKNCPKRQEACKFCGKVGHLMSTCALAGTKSGAKKPRAVDSRRKKKRGGKRRATAHRNESVEGLIQRLAERLDGGVIKKIAKKFTDMANSKGKSRAGRRRRPSSSM